MCEYEQRNLAIIEAIMLDLGVSDIEELPAKVHEIKVAAQHRLQSDVLITCAKCGLYHSVYIPCADTTVQNARR